MLEYYYIYFLEANVWVTGSLLHNKYKNMWLFVSFLCNDRSTALTTHLQNIYFNSLFKTLYWELQ